MVEIGLILKEYFDKQGITQVEIAKRLDVSKAYINALFTGKSKFGKQQAVKWSKVFGLSESWLLTGEGSMLNQPSVIQNNTNASDEPADADLIPLLPVSAQGGSLNDFVVSVRDADCERVVSPVKDAELAIYVAGDSMAPEYPNGSQVHVKRINEKAFIEWGKVYVLDTCNGTVIKRVVPSDKEGCLRCVSINPAPIYAPFDISTSDIYGIYRVLLCLSVK